ncbi:MAG: hypothetical protein NTW41_01885 [Verrucomicrobia bacterium]|jgi:hypothetical protein|nr:hypothetical protein [Verrucomicrobiota bacterium]
MTSIPIPEELQPAANEITDLPERVARFIKAEISRRNLQKNRYGSDILSLVDKAFAEAQNIKSAGFDLAEARAEMARLHSNMTKS